MKAAQKRNKKFAYEKKIKIHLGEYGELVHVWRGSAPKTLLEFSVGYRTIVDEKWYIIRRHCWTLHQDKFHTHVRTGLSKRDWKKVYPPNIRGSIVRVLNWAKRDMITHWFDYLKSFEKLVRMGKREGKGI